MKKIAKKSYNYNYKYLTIVLTIHIITVNIL